MSRWNNQVETVTLTTVSKVVKEARLQKLWVVIGNKWFTPEEFEKYANSNLLDDNYRFPHAMEDIKLGDPVEVIARMRTELEKKEKAITEWTLRVVEYYRNT